MTFGASQHTYLKVCLGSLVLSLLTHSAQLCFVKTSSFRNYAFPGYIQVFFSLFSLSLCKFILFVFFLSSVQCLLNSSTVSLSCFLLTVPTQFFCSCLLLSSWKAWLRVSSWLAYWRPHKIWKLPLFHSHSQMQQTPSSVHIFSLKSSRINIILRVATSCKKLRVPQPLHLT